MLNICHTFTLYSYLVLPVNICKLPLVTWHTHSFKLSCEVYELQPSSLVGHSALGCRRTHTARRRTLVYRINEFINFTKGENESQSIQGDHLELLLMLACPWPQSTTHDRNIRCSVQNRGWPRPKGLPCDFPETSIYLDEGRHVRYPPGLSSLSREL